MTKIELEKENEALKNAIDEKNQLLSQQIHLASAVEAKDREINQISTIMKSEIEKRDQEISKLHEDIFEARKQLEVQKHLADAVEAKDKEINKLKQEIKIQTEVITEESRKEMESKQTLADEKLRRREVELETRNKELEKAVEYLKQGIIRYKQAYWSSLKSTQGTLENAVELGACIDRDYNFK